MKVYAIVLKDGRIFFDDCSSNINEARHSASLQWGSTVQKVLSYRTFCTYLLNY